MVFIRCVHSFNQIAEMSWSLEEDIPSFPVVENNYVLIFRLKSQNTVLTNVPQELPSGVYKPHIRP